MLTRSNLHLPKHTGWAVSENVSRGPYCPDLSMLLAHPRQPVTSPGRLPEVRWNRSRVYYSCPSQLSSERGKTTGRPPSAWCLSWGHAKINRFGNGSCSWQ